MHTHDFLDDYKGQTPKMALSVGEMELTSSPRDKDSCERSPLVNWRYWLAKNMILF